MEENVDKKKEYENDPERITYMGSIDYRNKMVKFGIKAKDRTKHLYVIGKSGMGKSTLLENMAIQDIQNGEGMAFIDPHGGAAEKLLDFVPEERKKDVIYFAPFDTEYPIALNVLEKVDISKRHLVANGLMASFKKVFGEDKFSDRMQNILNNIILALLENDDETLIGINRMLSDKEYRKKMVSNVEDPSIKSFWTDEFAKAGEKYQQEAAPAIQNKIGQFTSNPLIRNIIGQKKTSFDFRQIMDERKILIINLSKGKMGEGNANLIGSLLITKIYLAAMSRADVSPYELEKLPPFYFYVDEFQNFANDSFAQILSEARKYQLALSVAHQYVDQMTEEIKAAIFGNIGTMVTFRVGATDAQIFEKEFAPVFTADNIVNLSAFQMYLRLMIDSVGSKPFSARGLLPIQRPEKSFAEEIIEYSRHKYGRPKEEVEEEIAEWYEPVNKKIEKKEQNKKEEKENIKTTTEKGEEEPKTPQRTGRTRSKRRETDIVEANLSQVRQEAEKVKKELKSNHTTLKDAITKAMKEENKKQEILKAEKTVSVPPTPRRGASAQEEQTEGRQTPSPLRGASPREASVQETLTERIPSSGEGSAFAKSYGETQVERSETEGAGDGLNKKTENEMKEVPEKVLRDLVDEE